MADHIELDVKNPAVGSTEIGNGNNNDMNDKLADLKMNLEKPKDEENDLSSLESVVGLPFEKDIPLENLILPPIEWNDIFKKADDKDIQKMAASIYQYGLLHKITLWEKDDDKYMILGGSTRYAAYRYLYQLTSDEKWTKIPAKIYSRNQIDRIDAKRIFIVSNTDQRQMSTTNIVNAYYNLIKLEKERAFYGSKIFTRDAAAKQANVPPSTFNNYLKLSSLIAPLVDEIDSKNLLLMSAYELAFIPEDLQQYIFDKKYYIKIKRKTAKDIRDKAKTREDIDKIIEKSKTSSKLFKYSIEFNEKLPENCEILPLVVNKDDKVEITKLLHQMINDSNFPDDVKNKLLQTLD